jgi:hypothetical protein
LEITLRGRGYPVSRLQDLLDAGKPANFISELSSDIYRIKRRDRTVALKEIQDILASVQRLAVNPLTRKGAGDAIVKLDEFLADAGNSDQTMRERVEETKDRVKSDLDLAESYDTKAEVLLSKLSAVREVRDALSLLSKARDLPSCSGVKPTQLAVPEIAAKADAMLERTVENRCQRLSKLKSITDFGRQEDDLNSCHEALRDKTHLQHKVADALAALQQAKGELEAKQSEDATLRTIDALSAQVPLLELEKNLDKIDLITGCSEESRVRLTAKRKELSDQIALLTAFAVGLEDRIATVKDADERRTLEREIDGKSALFAGHATNEAKLSTATTHCSQLAEFFSTITQLSHRGLKNPQDLRTVLDECMAVRQQFSSSISQAQSELIDEIVSRKQNDADDKVQAAKEWLLGMEKAWSEDNSNPAASRKKLSEPPAFLTEDARTALSALNVSIREQLESNDEDWIVAKFKEISDKSRRKKLVQRLQKLLSAE